MFYPRFFKPWESTKDCRLSFVCTHKISLTILRIHPTVTLKVFGCQDKNNVYLFWAR